MTRAWNALARASPTHSVLVRVGPGLTTITAVLQYGRVLEVSAPTTSEAFEILAARLEEGRQLR